MSNAIARSPAVTNAKSCDRWLAKAPVADPHQTCIDITALLAGLEHSAPIEGVWLDILDRLNTPIWVAIEEQIRHFTGYSVPLKDAEMASFDAVIRLLTVYGRSNKRLFCSAVDESRNAKHARRLALRAMQCARVLALAHFRARHELPASVWAELYEIFQLAKQRGLAEPIEQAETPRQSAEQLYIETALMHLILPYGRSAQEFRLMLDFTEEWAPLARINTYQGQTAAVGVALDAAGPPAMCQFGNATLRPGTRFIELRDVKHVLNRRIRAKEKEARSHLDFVREPAQQDTLPVLRHLKKSWFSSSQTRRYKRRVSNDRVTVIVGASAIHQALGGVRSSPATRADQRYTSVEREHLRLFGHFGSNRLGVKMNGTPEGMGSPPCDDSGNDHMEQWDLLDTGPDGYRVRRHRSGTAVHYQELVAIKPPGATEFTLTETRWLMMGTDGSVTLGLCALSGCRPRPLSIHALDSGGRPVKKNPGFGFSLRSVIDDGAFIVAPRRAFAVGATVGIETMEASKQFQLTSVLAQGYDFRVFSFSPTV